MSDEKHYSKDADLLRGVKDVLSDDKQDGSESKLDKLAEGAMEIHARASNQGPYRGDS